MNFDFFESLPDVARNKFLQYLNAEDLAHFSACCKLWRDYANQDQLWYKQCLIDGFDKFRYLNDKPSHPSVPLVSSQTVISPIFLLPECESLSQPCKWKSIYIKSAHLINNWRHGHYTVAPLFKGHKGRISAFDSDGQIIVSGSSDEKLVKVWSIEDCECLYTIKSHLDTINGLKIYGQYFVLGGDDGIIRIYNKESGELAKKITVNEVSICKIYTYKGKLIVTFNDRSIRIWSFEKNFEIMHILRGHEDDIECINFYDCFAVSGSWDKGIILWNLVSGRKMVTLAEHKEVVNCLKMSDDVIVSGSSDSTVKIWFINIDEHDKKTVNCYETKTLEGHESDVYCLDFNDKYIVSSGADSHIIVWNFTGSLLHRLGGHLGVVRFLYMDEYKLLSGGDAKRIMVWDYKNGKQLNTLYRNPNRLHLMWIDDTKIITASPENESILTIILYW